MLRFSTDLNMLSHQKSTKTNSTRTTQYRITILISTLTLTHHDAPNRVSHSTPHICPNLWSKYSSKICSRLDLLRFLETKYQPFLKTSKTCTQRTETFPKTTLLFLETHCINWRNAVSSGEVAKKGGSPSNCSTNLDWRN